MECPDMKIVLNKNKSIGKVLYIVEGNKTEPYILRKMFANIFDYQVRTVLRNKKYKIYNSKTNPTSQVFVINTEESNIKYIDKDNEFLNNLFKELIEGYDFDIDNAAIYYLFDRDNQSNTDSLFIKGLLKSLTNARENKGYLRQGLLLLSYPSVESFTLSNFEQASFLKSFNIGKKLKKYLDQKKINHKNITEETIIHAVGELFNALLYMNINSFNIDSFFNCNMDVFVFEESKYAKDSEFMALSLICVSLIDLGIIEVDL